MKKKDAKNKKKLEFSKKLLVQESALIWIMAISFIVLAFICIINQYMGELPWLTTMVAFPWSAYAISQRMYYKKSLEENLHKYPKGINEDNDEEDEIDAYDPILDDEI